MLAQTLPRHHDSLPAGLIHAALSVANLDHDPLLIPLLAQPARVGIASAPASCRTARRSRGIASRRLQYARLWLSPSIVLGSQRNFVRFLAAMPITIRWATTLRVCAQHRIRNYPVVCLLGRSGRCYIPLPERFFGGGNSHRGFPDNQAGPRDSLNRLSDRRQCAAVQSATELRFPLIGDNIGGVFFHDMGNVYSGFNHFLPCAPATTG